MILLFKLLSCFLGLKWLLKLDIDVVCEMEVRGSIISFLDFICCVIRFVVMMDRGKCFVSCFDNLNDFFDELSGSCDGEKDGICKCYSLL